MRTHNERFEQAVRLMDEANSQDPNHEFDGGVERPRELLYAERLTRWIEALEPEASEALLLAARSQHIRRWEVPRTSYPATRPGYLKWREDLKKFHAQTAGEILLQCGYSEEMIRRVQELNLKLNIKSDREAQLLEDALCLVFLEFQLEDLLQRLDPDKVVNAVRKSWLKMSETGRARALGLEYSAAARDVIAKALEKSPEDSAGPP